jgi:16S rRNA (guanine1207-N2)-methyltransferase
VCNGYRTFGDVAIEVFRQSPVDDSCGKYIKNRCVCNFDLVDVNLRAVNLAKQNAINNNTPNVNVFESNTYQNVVGQYDLIVTNPPIRAGKHIVHDIILNGFNYLNIGGSLWCVIQKKQGAPSAIKALEEKYRSVSVVAKDKGYYIIKAEK